MIFKKGSKCPIAHKVLNSHFELMKKHTSFLVKYGIFKFMGRKKEIIEYSFLSVHFTLAYSIVFLGDVWYLWARKKEVIKNETIFN